jgi:hypothetical protein
MNSKLMNSIKLKWLIAYACSSPSNFCDSLLYCCIISSDELLYPSTIGFSLFLSFLLFYSILLSLMSSCIQILYSFRTMARAAIIYFLYIHSSMLWWWRTIYHFKHRLGKLVFISCNTKCITTKFFHHLLR